jgi:hypothetical protein
MEVVCERVATWWMIGEPLANVRCIGSFFRSFGCLGGCPATSTAKSSGGRREVYRVERCEEHHRDHEPWITEPGCRTAVTGLPREGGGRRPAHQHKKGRWASAASSAQLAPELGT